MSFINHSSFLTTTYEQVENHYTRKNELIQILSENNIQHKVHLSVLKLYNVSFMQIETQKSNVNNHSQKVLNAIRNCIDIKTLDLSDCTNIPKIIEDFPYLNTIIFPVFLYFIPRIEKCPSILKISFPKKGVTRIESNNFKNYPSIDELILDENLISIDSFAFRTSSIKRVNLSKCENLDSKKLNERAFSNSSIEEIVLPQQVNILPWGAFLNCKHLRTITGSNLLATYTDNYKTHAVQFDRAVHSCKFCFENCNNLQFIQFSPKLSIDGIKRLLCHSGYNEDKTCYEKENFYNDKRCGIVLEIDDYYSYIWCFTDFTFYLSKKIDKSFLNKIVSFYNSNTRSIEIENGKCWISCDCNDHVALGVSLGWNYHFNSIFDKHLNKLGTVSIENDQKKALEIYQNQTLLQIIDVKTKINELENLVDTLDINSIINSYNSTYEYKYISRYRSDDDERLYIYRKASYSDLYLETLLPTQYFKSERGFADSNNYKLGSMSERELMIDDEIIKQNAREKYDKEEHKRMIINRFIKDSIENEKFVEKCLRINEAKSLLMKYENSVDGKHKIILLNSIIQG